MPATPARKKVAAAASKKAAKPALKAVKAPTPAPKKARGSSPQEHMVAMKANLPAKTGKTFEQWVEAARKGPPEVKALVAWLKEKGLGTVQATLVAHQVHGGYMAEHEDPAALLEGNFAGEKAALRPIYDALEKAARKLGEDLILYPCKTYITLKRGRQIGIVKVAKGRIDLGLILPGVEASGRLEKATSSIGNDRVTHKVALASKKDVDAEALGYLKQAYTLDGRAKA